MSVLRLSEHNGAFFPTDAIDNQSPLVGEEFDIENASHNKDTEDDDEDDLVYTCNLF
jgi:hypothetical protein